MEKKIKINFCQFEKPENFPDPSKEEIKLWKKENKDIDADLEYIFSNKKVSVLENLVKSKTGRETGSYLNPLCSKEEFELLTHPPKFHGFNVKKLCKRFENKIVPPFLDEESVLSEIAKKNKIPTKEIPNQTVLEVRKKVRKINSNVHSILEKNLLISLMSPITSRIFMEDFLENRVKSKMIIDEEKEKIGWGEKGLKYGYYHGNPQGGKKWFDMNLFEKTACVYFDIDGKQILSEFDIDTSLIPIGQRNFFVGYWGNIPGSTLNFFDLESRKVRVYINQEIAQASLLNLLDLKFPQFVNKEISNLSLSVIKKLVSKKNTISINGWEVEISNLCLEDFLCKLTEIVKDERTKKAGAYEKLIPTSTNEEQNISSYLINSMFATNNWAYKNATEESKKLIYEIGKNIQSIFERESKQTPNPKFKRPKNLLKNHLEVALEVLESIPGIDSNLRDQKRKELCNILYLEEKFSVGPNFILKVKVKAKSKLRYSLRLVNAIILLRKLGMESEEQFSRFIKN